MTCIGNENDLALYVEGDLPRNRAPALEDHLRECATCRDFLSELQSSQRAVKDLAAGMIGAEALASLRVRIASAPVESPKRLTAAWRWTIAAGVAALAAATWWLAPSSVTAPNPAKVVRLPATAPGDERGLKGPGVGVALHDRAPERKRRTVRAERRASAHVEPPAPTSTLSPEDADRLARALVAVSHIDRVTDALGEPPPSPMPATLIRLATADPNVVIYWRLDSSGGK
jgi:anti-sigma factor RsiW